MANEINAVAGQLWGVPVGQVYTAGPGIVIDNVHKTVRVGTLEWEDVTSTMTGTSATTKLIYCPATKVCVLTVVSTRNISTGAVSIGTLAADYRPATSIIGASCQLNNNAYIRGFVESTGNVGVSVAASQSNVGLRFFATWVVGQ